MLYIHVWVQNPCGKTQSISEIKPGGKLCGRNIKFRGLNLFERLARCWCNHVYTKTWCFMFKMSVHRHVEAFMFKHYLLLYLLGHCWKTWHEVVTQCLMLWSRGVSLCRGQGESWLPHPEPGPWGKIRQHLNLLFKYSRNIFWSKWSDSDSERLNAHYAPHLHSH